MHAPVKSSFLKSIVAEESTQSLILPIIATIWKFHDHSGTNLLYVIKHLFKPTPKLPKETPMLLNLLLGSLSFGVVNVLPCTSPRTRGRVPHNI
jgi:hypothetical protein